MMTVKASTIGCAALLFACGGEPFTALVVDAESSDAGTPDDAQAQGDALFERDAADDRLMSDSDSSALDASICTPITPYNASLGCPQKFSIPSQFCLESFDDGGPTGSETIAATPSECRCRETYNCTCILAHDPCGGRSSSCAVIGPDSIVVQCR